jgi:hypothetical protein
MIRNFKRETHLAEGRPEEALGEGEEPRTNMSKNPGATPGVAQRYDTAASASATPGAVMVSPSFWGSVLR